MARALPPNCCLPTHQLTGLQGAQRPVLSGPVLRSVQAVQVTCRFEQKQPLKAAENAGHPHTSSHV